MQADLVSVVAAARSNETEDESGIVPRLPLLLILVSRKIATSKILTR